MIAKRLLAAALVAACASVAFARLAPLEEQNDRMFERLQRVHGLSDRQMAELRRIFARSGYIGQGNPAISRHPLSPQQCRDKVAASGASYENASFEAICKAKYMAPLYDPARERPGDATACIDQFEFPDIPCEFPVVWVRAREAAEICAAEGKRLCDAHEWEGACDGRLQPPDYRFDLATGPPNVAIARMAAAHNATFKASARWSYGPEYEKGVCAAASQKSDGCNGGGWSICGSNTYPAGSFPGCRSPLGVYDLNGNAAEHMNLPLAPSQMASRGSTELGYTEMKGSWFIFDRYRAHPDWCRWRAPYWHGSRVMDEHSHANYHLGFRCCKSLK
jgi:formylglycine-generating enzyme required for sulfatase activity